MLRLGEFNTTLEQSSSKILIKTKNNSKVLKGLIKAVNLWSVQLHHIKQSCFVTQVFKWLQSPQKSLKRNGVNSNTSKLSSDYCSFNMVPLCHRWAPLHRTSLRGQSLYQPEKKRQINASAGCWKQKEAQLNVPLLQMDAIKFPFRGMTNWSEQRSHMPALKSTTKHS